MGIKQEIEIKWHYSNREYYESMGYFGFENGKRFTINVADLKKGSHVKLDCMCDRCGKRKKTINKSFVNSKQFDVYKYNKFYCNKCAIYLFQSKTHEEFLEEIKQLHGNNYSLLTEYIKSTIDVIVKHEICCHQFSTTPNQFLSGSECPKCYGTPKKTTEDFYEEVKEITNGEYELLTEYLTALDNIKLKHMKCGHEYEVRPNDFLNGNRCPKCKESKGENRIRKFLEGNQISFEDQKKFDMLLGVGGKNLSYDFYLPKQNILIEYQGEFHDGSATCQNENQFKRQWEHDRRKREYAKSNNIMLLEIWYWDFDNIEKILDQYISSKMASL